VIGHPIRTAGNLCTCLLLAGALLGLVGCGEPPSAGTPVDWLAAGDGATARRAWREAAQDYLKAFRLEEPAPARRGARARLAFRIGEAWAAAAPEASLPRLREDRAERALFWFGHALALDAGLRQAWFERARIQDGDITGVRDLTGAHDAYAAYVESFAGGEPEGERERSQMALARQRVEALGPPVGPVAPPRK